MKRPLLIAVFLGAFLGTVYTHSQVPLGPRRDVVIEVKSVDGKATLQATVGIRVVNESGTILAETDPRWDDTVTLYGQLLAGPGLTYGNHTFPSREFRKELANGFKKLLF